MYSLTDAAQYKGANILVVGGGDSAAEAALGLSNQEGNTVTLSYRKKEFGRLKEKNAAALQKAIESGKIRFVPESAVSRVSAGDVELRSATGATETIPNDYIFALIGGTSPNAFLKKIGVEMVTKEVAIEEQKVPA